MLPFSQYFCPKHLQDNDGENVSLEEAKLFHADNRGIREKEGFSLGLKNLLRLLVKNPRVGGGFLTLSIEFSPSK